MLVLKPYVANAPEKVIPLQIFNSYRCYMMGSVVQKIQELGVEVMHIPGRCTCLCQPVDIGFNKPFKNHMRKQWVSWMIAKGIIHGTTRPPLVDHAMAKMMAEERAKDGVRGFQRRGVKT